MNNNFEMVLLKNRRSDDRPVSLDEYRAAGGYEALTAALKQYTPRQIKDLVKEAGLRGRGGAAFPTGLKWLGLADDAAFPR